MHDLVWIALIGAMQAVLTAVIGAWVVRMQYRIRAQASQAAVHVKEVKAALEKNPPATPDDLLPIAQAMNGLKDQLVAEVRKSSHAEGVLAGQAKLTDYDLEANQVEKHEFSIRKALERAEAQKMIHR